jgi:hypothetical protein
LCVFLLRLPCKTSKNGLFWARNSGYKSVQLCPAYRVRTRVGGRQNRCSGKSTFLSWSPTRKYQSVGRSGSL